MPERRTGRVPDTSPGQGDLRQTPLAPRRSEGLRLRPLPAAWRSLPTAAAVPATHGRTAMVDFLL